MYASGVPAEPFDAFRYPTASIYPGSRASRPAKLASGERTQVLVGVGQSNIAASETNTYVPSNASKVDNFNVYDGGVYQTLDPLLGTGIYNSGGLWLSRLADKLIDANYCDRVIIAPIARGSSTVADWGPGGFLNPSLMAAARRLAVLGITNVKFMWVQGEADVGFLTGAQYSGRLQAVIASVRAEGFVSPWLLGKSTRDAGGGTNAPIRSGIDMTVNGVDIIAGGDNDTVGSGGRGDGVHFNGTGAEAVASLWSTIIQALPL